MTFTIKTYIHSSSAKYQQAGVGFAIGLAGVEFNGDPLSRCKYCFAGKNQALSLIAVREGRAEGSTCKIAAIRDRNSLVTEVFSGNTILARLIWSVIWCVLEPSNGSDAYTNAYKTTPRAQISIDDEQLCADSASGA